MLSPILTVLMRIDSNYTFEMPRACLSCADVGFLVILHQSRYWTALPEIAWTFSKYLRFDSAFQTQYIYRSQGRERERDILWLDKPWSVRIVSIACHPSIHLSILETLYTTCPFQELILSSESTYYTPLPLHRCDETAECAECLQYPARRGTQLANSSVFSGLQLHHSSIPLPPRHPTFVVSGIKDGRIKTEKSSAA